METVRALSLDVVLVVNGSTDLPARAAGRWSAHLRGLGLRWLVPPTVVEVGRIGQWPRTAVAVHLTGIATRPT